MGLDMYLTKRTYVKNFEHMKESERHAIIIKKGGVVRKDIKAERISLVVEDIGYWRKANAIHKWFVDNVQNGEDDCEEHYVSKEKIKELLAVVNKVLGAVKLSPAKVHTGYHFEKGKMEEMTEDGEIVVNEEVAEELLPTCDGFFFGGTQYNNFYVDDLKYTKKVLEEALEDIDSGDIYYHSSW